MVLSQAKRGFAPSSYDDISVKNRLDFDHNNRHCIHQEDIHQDTLELINFYSAPGLKPSQQYFVLQRPTSWPRNDGTLCHNVREHKICFVGRRHFENSCLNFKEISIPSPNTAVKYSNRDTDDNILNYKISQDYEYENGRSMCASLHWGKYPSENSGEQSVYSTSSTQKVFSYDRSKQTYEKSRSIRHLYLRGAPFSDAGQISHSYTKDPNNELARECQRNIRQYPKLHAVQKCSHVFRNSSNLWVDLHQSSASLRYRGAESSELFQLVPEWTHRTFCLSWARKLLVYLLVFSILVQTCCEAGPLPHDRTKLHLSQDASLVSRTERLSLPFAHLLHTRRRRSQKDDSSSPNDSKSSSTHSDSSFPTPSSSSSNSLQQVSSSPASLSSSSSSSASSSSSSSSPATSNIPQTSISSRPSSFAEFLIPNSLNQSELVLLLAATLQRLHLLHDKNLTTSPRCFRIKKVSRNPSPQSKPSASRSPDTPGSVEISLVIEELYTHPANNSATSSSNENSNNNNNNNNSSNSDNSDAMYDIVCLKDTVKPLILGKERTKSELTRHNSFLHSGRLSRTQIVVISTCSAIIGMFFLIAAFLRIRNYIKRIRLEQAMANRPKFRSCSVALRNPVSSMEQLRRDSLASKASHQNSVTTKGSNYSNTNASSREDDSSTSSPRHDPDTTPLLVITRADPSNPAALTTVGAGDIVGRGGANGGPANSAPSAGVRRLGTLDTPTQSDSSLQYIDEERGVSRKKTPMSSSLVKNASGEGGGYTICMNPKGHHSNSRSPERPGTLPTGRDVITKTSKVQGQNETQPAATKRFATNRSGKEGSTEMRSGGRGAYSPGGIPDASPTALLSPARSSVDGNINPSFSSGTISACSPAGDEASKTYASDPCMAWSKGRPSTLVGDIRRSPRNASLSLKGSPRVKSLVRASSAGKHRAGAYQPVGSQDGDQSTGHPAAVCPLLTETRPMLESEGPLVSNQDHCDRVPESLSVFPTRDNKNPEDLNMDTNNLVQSSASTNSAETTNTNSVGTEDSKLRDQSCFGLTQSDTSICSASNQGREFSGQEEYHPDMDSPGEDCSLVSLRRNSEEEGLDIPIAAHQALESSSTSDPQICITEALSSVVKEDAEDVRNAQLPLHADTPPTIKSSNLLESGLDNPEQANGPVYSEVKISDSSPKSSHPETDTSLESYVDETYVSSNNQTEENIGNTTNHSFASSANLNISNPEANEKATNKQNMLDSGAVLEHPPLKKLPDKQNPAIRVADNNNSHEKGIYLVSNGAPKQSLGERRMNGKDDDVRANSMVSTQANPVDNVKDTAEKDNSSC